MPWKLCTIGVLCCGLLSATDSSRMIDRQDVILTPSIDIASSASSPIGSSLTEQLLEPHPAQIGGSYQFSIQDDVDDESTSESDVSNDESLLLEQPDTPAKIFDAVELMIDLGRPNLARKYLKQLMAAQPTDDDLLAMRKKYGPAAFLKLANDETMHPDSLELLDLMNAAITRWGEDPERMAELIKELLESSPFERRAAVQQLRNAGPRVVPLMIKALPGLNQAERNSILLATGEMGEGIIPTLIAATDADNEIIQTFAIDALGLVGNSQTIPYLWYYAEAEELPKGTRETALSAITRILRYEPHKAHQISLYGAAEGLRKYARDQYRAMTMATIGDNSVTEYWKWDPQARTIVSEMLPAQTIALLKGTRFARQALALSPDHRDGQILFLSLALASEAMLAGWDNPLPVGAGTAHDLCLASGSEMTSEVLSLAMREGNTAVAVASLNALKNIASRHDLGTREGKPSPILSALNYPDRRVQFMAAHVILHLDPERPFRGAGRIVQILKRALDDSSVNSAVVIDADGERGAKYKAFLQGANFDALQVATGKEGFTQAAERLDIELILMHANTIRWDLSQTIANVRADSRTASIPIVVYGDIELRAKINELLKSYAPATYIVESSTPEDFMRQVTPFLDQRKAPPLSLEYKQDQQAVAMFWLSHIARGRRTDIYQLDSVEDAVFRAVETPELAEGGISVLGAIPTRSAQESLAELVLNERLSNAHREIAALQMVFHIQRHGLTLSDNTLNEIDALYASTDDSGMYTALTSLRGVLKPNAAEVTERLRGFSTTPPKSAPATEEPQPEPETQEEPATDDDTN